MGGGGGGGDRRSCLYALFSEIATDSRRHVGGFETSAKCLDGTVDADDSSRAFARHVQVVGNGSRRHFENVVRSAFVEEHLAKGRQKGARRAAA